MVYMLENIVVLYSGRTSRTASCPYMYIVHGSYIVTYMLNNFVVCIVDAQAMVYVLPWRGSIDKTR